MSQLLKKFALLTACAVLALCFATRPAHAQMVAPSGTGEHLLFAYWSSANSTNTNVNIHSPLGVRGNTADETMNVVRVVIRDDMLGKAADFKVCLTPGDSWTAVLSMGNLMVMDAGECDDDVQQPGASTDRSGGGDMIATPMMGEMVSLGDTDHGWLEAWLAPTGGLMDNTLPCSATYTAAGATDAGGGASAGDAVPNGVIISLADPANHESPNCTTGEVVGDSDKNGLAENASPMYISGTAMLVSPTAGFSSTYDATALTMCGNRATEAAAAAMIMMAGDDGNGCWHTIVDTDTTTDGNQMDAAGSPITTALMGTDAGMMDRDILTGRWTAINNDDVMSSHTKVVLTFPVAHLNYEAKKADGHEEDVERTDPVSIIAFNDMGMLALDNREVILGMNVNTCIFGSMPDMMGDHDMDMDMDEGMTSADMHGDDMDMMPMLSCNGMEVDALDGTSGGFRIFNNSMAMVTNDDPTTTGADENEADIADGAERDDYGTTTPVPATDADASGQVPAESLNAIGLVFSYFMGTDGMQYDQVSMLGSIDVDRDGNETDGSDDATATPSTGDTGLDMF